MAQILWLASYPKSGNTWVRLFLANYLADGSGPFEINRLPEFSFSDMRMSYYAQAAGRPAETLSTGDINRLRPAVHRLLAAARPGLVPVKTHSAMAAIEGVPTITPEVTAAAIYVARNPLDVAVSFGHHYGLPMANAVRAISFPGLKTVAQAGHVVQLLADWSGHVQSWLDTRGLKLHLVRYEDLLCDPLSGFASVTGFLGYAEDRERLCRAVERAEFRVLVEQESQDGFIEASNKGERFFRRGVAGGWRDELTAAESAYLIDRHQDMLRRLGYLDDRGSLSRLAG